MWIAPNLLTFLGFINQVMAFIFPVILIGSGEVVEANEAYYWVPLASAIFIFTYMFLDNIDGKQARRTKTSSPLGELIDHGCDAMNVGIGSITVGVLVGADPWWILYISAFSSLPFYLSHWQEYLTHSLELGMFNGPTEAEVIAISVFVCTYFQGLTWWRSSITLLSYTVQRQQIVMLIAMAMAIGTFFEMVWKGSREAMKKGVPILEAYSQLIPFTICWVSTALWLLGAPDVFEAHPFLAITSFGLVFATIVCRCIVQRICREPFRLFYPVLTPLVLAALNSASRQLSGKAVVNEYYVLYFVFISTSLFWSHFAVSIVKEMCSALKISAFTIPYNKPKRT